ncbi:protein of unknown function [Taphrina deformans PYCC 5710]|uniref:Uncharacterized protein n=1 Tax=Taphrina deformans (strain PYCC 5710 / ATCC 11124 / CBS 356.35 / IMI 108563 / JCM 9778 / NBRC 8474) TaxID=1097556 RepID=R4XBJ3_TAPDE|nr:protein of unknown function [Taphrina deformans PYCC 5710]|eukprot:CCG83148.1 protein of unknown function [Taphrina deformans PYCC 5710]
MLEPSQSFTLDDNERQQILGAVAIDTLDPSSPTPQTVLDVSPQEPLTCENIKPDTGNARLFDHSYSQRFSQTQEDTSSFRQQIDEAPPEERDTLDIENIFDAESGALDFRPLETSTAIGAAKAREEDFSPPSSIDDGDTSVDETFSNRPVETPAAGRYPGLATA